MNSTDNPHNLPRDDTAAPRGEPMPFELYITIFFPLSYVDANKPITLKEAMECIHKSYDIGYKRGYHDGKLEGEKEVLAAMNKDLLDKLKPDATPPPQVHIDKSDNVSINE